MVDGSHRKETVTGERLGDSGMMGTSTTKEAKHNWILERARGKGTRVEGAGYHSAGHRRDKTAAADTAEEPRQTGGLVSASSLPGGDPTPAANGLSWLQSRSQKPPPLTQPGVCKGRGMERGSWKKPGGFPAREPSAAVCDVQETTSSQRSFEALGSAC